MSALGLCVALGCRADGDRRAEAWLTVEMAARGSEAAAGEAVGNTLAVVETGGEPRTVVAERLPDPVVATLSDPDGEGGPATARLRLPVPPPEWARADLEIVLFRDGDDDGELDPGEPWVSAWDGGRDSYRLAFRPDPGRWVLIEGGLPGAEHDPATTPVNIDPYIRAVTGSTGPDEES